MRLLLTAHRLHPHVGGTEIAVDQLATHFAARGHDVTVATSQEPGALAREHWHGYNIRRYPHTRVGQFRIPPREYRELLRREPYDIVHLHGQRVWSTDFQYPSLARSLSPVVFTAHGFAQWHRRRKPFIDAAYYRVVLPRALAHTAAVTALTQAEKEDLLGWGVPAEKISVIGDGYDPAEFVALPSGFRERYEISGPFLLYAGGFYPNKRVDRLVEAAAGLDATLVALGADADATRANVERLAAEKGVRLRALGRIPREEVLAAYREADLFLLGSDFEGFGLVLLEAMAAGLPFLSTPCGAAPDLAATGGGEVADASGFPSALRELLADAGRRARLGAAGREAAKRYTWEHVANQYLELFEGLARR